MSKFLRDLKRVAEDEGFVYEGYAGSTSSGPGSGHYVFTDKASGAVVRTSSTPKSEGNTLKNARGNFRKARVQSASKAGAFRSWILKRYKVGRNGSKVITVQISELVAEYNAQADASHQINAAHVTVMIGQDATFERVSFKRGGTEPATTTIKLMGPLYGLTKEPDEPTTAENPCQATFQTLEKGIAVCTRELGHDGLHFDSFRKVRWAEGSGVKVLAHDPVDPVIDPVAQASLHALPKLADQVTQTPAPMVLEPINGMIGGLTLSDELADQLREALGVPNAAMASDVHDQALRALTDAQEALQMALDALNGLPVIVPKAARKRRELGEPDRSRIGPVQRGRLDAIVAAVADGRLPERFIVQDVQELFGLSEGQAVSTLARGQRDGDTVRRIAPNTYELRI